jgi:nicotinamidase-related amidase
MSQTAVILLDYQMALCVDGPLCRMPPLAAQVSERRVIDRAESVLTTARSTSTPVVHVRLAFDPSYQLRTNRSARFDVYEKERAMLAGSPETAFVAALEPLVSEPIITKGAVNAFVGTPLEAMLSGRGIRDVVLLGVATNLVVESTARLATDLGFHVTVLDDCCASPQSDLHAFAIERIFPMFATVTSSEKFIAQLEGSEK